MQRRVKEPDGNRQISHDLEDLDEVVLLVWQNLV